jgi:DNA-binding GntR family transcriptional regulator
MQTAINSSVSPPEPDLYEMPKQLTRSRPLEPRDADVAYEGIVEMVLTRQLRLGERTSVVQIADRLGLGRTPVKEAITRLEAEGILTIEERAGTTVNAITPEAAANVFALRRNLESFGALAAVKNVTDTELEHLRTLVDEMSRACNPDIGENIDLSAFVKSNVRFHAGIIRAAKNPILDRLYAQIQLQAQIVTYLFHSSPSPQQLQPRQNQHIAILNALEARDADRLSKLLEEHAKETEDSVQKAIANLAKPTRAKRRSRGAPATQPAAS